MGDVLYLFPHVIITSIITVFIMGAIVIRIPPISSKKDVYIDGNPQTKEHMDKSTFDLQIFSRALFAAANKAKSNDLSVLRHSFWGAAKFAQKDNGLCIIDCCYSIAYCYLYTYF